MIAERFKGKKLQNDTLQIGSEAKKRKQENKNTIDATLGILVNEEGTFYSFPTIDHIIKNLEDDDFYNYSPTDGGEAYKQAVLNWVFQDYLHEMTNNFHYHIVATAGGTGAISNAVAISTNPNESLILPNIYWGAYNTIASANGLSIKKYQMLSDFTFNIAGFSHLFNEVATKEGKVTIIVNDPCHNPTGYTLSEEELLQIIKLINSKPEIPCSLIYDIAYFDYPITRTNFRKKLTLLSHLHENTIINIAFSCSKSFSIYGMRTGAHIILGKNQDLVREFYHISAYLARTRWSNITRAGINMLVRLDQDKTLYEQFLKEHKYALQTLKERAQIFIKEAAYNKLNIYPYYGGFFITLIYHHSAELTEALKKEDIFVIPLEKAIRISISSLPQKDLPRLAKKIKDIIERLEKNN